MNQELLLFVFAFSIGFITRSAIYAQNLIKINSGSRQKYLV